MSITPLRPDPAKPHASKTVPWRYESVGGALQTEDALHQIVLDAHLSSDKAVYECSFISCSHHEGKSWDSMFIPLTTTGHLGMSITWWRRAAGAAGTLLIKSVTEAEWYSVVKTKAVDKGYDVNSFIGREQSLSSRHSFVRDLHSQESRCPSLPCAALLESQTQAMAQHAVGANLGTFCNLVPVHAVLQKISALGHPIAARLQTLLKQTNVQLYSGLINGFISKLDSLLTSAGSSSTSSHTESGTIVQPPTRAETYGARWGAFG